MTDSELAWIAREYVNGRRQIDIALDLDTTQSAICTAIVQFCRRHGFEVLHKLYSDSRRDCARASLEQYHGGFTRPGRRPSFRMDHTLSMARHEHAWLLRAEGFSLQAIGDRLGVCRERARQIIGKHGRRVNRALRHASFTVSEGLQDAADHQ
jgi:hypothetical protein